MEEVAVDFSQFVETIFRLPLFKVNDTPITIFSLVILIAVLVINVFFARFSARILKSKILRRFDIDQAVTFTLAKLLQYVMIVLGSIFAFQFIGIDLSGLTVIFGLLSVGIGFGLQNLTSNFISGLIVLFERPIAVGDRIIVNNMEGDVEDINIRATTIVTVDNQRIIVPNENFISSSVTNLSHGDSRLRLNINVGVSYGSDVDLVKKALLEVADENTRVLKNPKSMVQFLAFGDSSLDFQLWAWIDDAKNHPFIRTELNTAIFKKFTEYQIQIPFPQRDLHIISPKRHHVEWKNTPNETAS